jgi:ABC-type Fe3+/spermidine/putrescine transport system ATPase subunit
MITKKDRLEGVSKTFGGGVVRVKDTDLQGGDGESLIFLLPSCLGKV